MPAREVVLNFLAGLSTAFLHLPQGLGFGLLVNPSLASRFSGVGLGQENVSGGGYLHRTPNQKSEKATQAHTSP